MALPESVLEKERKDHPDDYLKNNIAYLYDGESEDISVLLGLKLAEIESDSEKWTNSIHSHIERIANADECIKLNITGKDFRWLNTINDLSTDAELNGKLIVLDFFTYCCINCEHALKFVKLAEEEFKLNPELAVIGVHSPKFPTEKDFLSVKDALKKNNIKHPVINDPENSLWLKLGIYCWPTVLIIGPDQKVLFSLVGENQIEKLSYLCRQTLGYLRLKNVELNTSPLYTMEEAPNAAKVANAPEVAGFPSGISLLGDKIIVSCIGQNQLFALTFDGKVLDVIGSGLSGFEDGFFENCSFARPHGLASWQEDYVFVADTVNNSIRMVNFKDRTVKTVFDGNSFKSESKVFISDLHFSSPWDVCLAPKPRSDMSVLNALYVAVAGSHQIWVMNLNNILSSGIGYCVPFAGNGKEQNLNNMYPLKAGFAQPSGISYSKAAPGLLFVADSESSTIRVINLHNGHVKHCVGGGLDPMDLFQFGDTDGIAHEARLQHPLSVCIVNEEKVFVADSYNHKIKLLNALNKEIITFAGSSLKGHSINENMMNLNLNEPGCIVYCEKRGILVVADTNNNRLVLFTLRKRYIGEIHIKIPLETCVDGKPISPFALDLYFAFDKPSSVKIKLSPVGEIYCHFTSVNEDLLVTEGLFCPWDISFSGEAKWKVRCLKPAFEMNEKPFLVLKCRENEARSSLSSLIDISIKLTMCSKVKKICLVKTVKLTLEVDICSSAQRSVIAHFNYN